MARWLESSGRAVLIIAGLLALAGTFIADVWDFGYSVSPVVQSDSTIVGPATVRLSAAELVRTDGDTSMLDCYSCHEQDAPPELAFDEEGMLIWEEHRFDFDLQHGARHRNEFCYTCHVKENLELLRTPDGKTLPITEGNAHCGACHGTAYRDWEEGIHGLLTGYWDRSLGSSKQEDCTSCHNAHTPSFPSLKPWPGPQPLRPKNKSDGGVSDRLAQGGQEASDQQASETN